MSQILGFIGDQIDPANFVDGFCPAHALNLEALEVDYIERKPFAEDPANGYIHFIPYIVIRDPKTGKVFKYTRSTKGNDDNQYNANGVLLNSNKPESWNLTKERKK